MSGSSRAAPRWRSAFATRSAASPSSRARASTGGSARSSDGSRTERARAPEAASIRRRPALERVRAARASNREPAPDRAGRAPPRRRPERDHRRDRGGQDGARPLARPACWAAGRDRRSSGPAPRRPGSRGCSRCPTASSTNPSLPRSPSGFPRAPTRWSSGRRVGASGRTSAFVGGRAASAADLQSLGGRLLAFYGQHEHRRLTLACRPTRDPRRLRRAQARRRPATSTRRRTLRYRRSRGSWRT